MDLHLNDEQAEVLRDILDGTLGDLCYQIADTDNSRFKEQLRQRERVIRSLIELLPAVPSTVARGPA